MHHHQQCIFLISEILSGICQSPKYPLRYPSNTTSYCDINIENGYHGDVNIAFEFFEIQECSQCNCDRIDILVSNGSTLKISTSSTPKISTGSTHKVSTFCGSILPNGNGVIKGTFLILPTWNWNQWFFFHLGRCLIIGTNVYHHTSFYLCEEDIRFQE